jgi:hypothetical protein
MPAFDQSRRNNYSVPEPKRSGHTPRVEFIQLYAIYNVPHPSLLLHSRPTYKKHLPSPYSRDQKGHHLSTWQSTTLCKTLTNQQRLMAYLDSTFWRLSSYCQYIGLGKFTKAISTLQKVQENLNHSWPLYETASFWHPSRPTPHEFWTGIFYPIPTLDRTHLIYLHIQHLIAYSYITTHLPPHSIYLYNFRFLPSYNIYYPAMRAVIIPYISWCMGGQCTGEGSKGQEAFIFSTPVQVARESFVHSSLYLTKVKSS